MKLYSVTSLGLEQIYVFASGRDDAADVYTSFKALLGLAHQGFAVVRVDRHSGYKQDKSLQPILQMGVRGVGVPRPNNTLVSIDEPGWIVWSEHDPNWQPDL